ncbi:MAG: HAMP domain-containing histidine kinase [Anaerolineae bacterium]|jgi:signal transduction histidine kinase|nr:HAMP domain-containing histidine kinase [Anaerolineae bacterium]MBT7071765.1 HAMP domain-containing histidine kinase [Anaerolineae bacterium]MBT7324477.1 HAMP domain-containing histidine kinase [Anaerolineae bacterium]
MKFFSSLRSRLWLTYALLILAALGFLMIALTIYLLRSPLLYRQTTTRLQAIQTVILDRQNEFLGMSDQDLRNVLERADENFEVRFILFGTRDGLLYDTRADESKITLPRLSAARSTPSLRDDQGQLWLYVTARLENGQRLVVATPRPTVPILTVLRDELFPPFWGAGTLALLFSLLLAFGMARWVADPLQGMLTAADEMPAPVTEVPVRGPQEVRELAQAFNEMVERVQTTQQSQRDFVANVSHELKTPLTSIQGFAQALLDGAAETPESRQQAAQVIYDESGRMHRMALDLLELARFDAGIVEMEFVPVDVAALLRNADEKFALQANQKEVALQIDTPDPATVMGDGDRLAQVFTNLIDNALKHTSAQDTVHVRAEALSKEIYIRVSDSGAGISPKALPHIFERFYQADPARSRQGKHSSGLGLAIVREIVLAHGGKISVQSEVGKGTTFTLSLPALSS